MGLRIAGLLALACISSCKSEANVHSQGPVRQDAGASDTSSSQDFAPYSIDGEFQIYETCRATQGTYAFTVNSQLDDGQWTNHVRLISLGISGDDTPQIEKHIVFETDIAPDIGIADCSRGRPMLRLANQLGSASDSWIDVKYKDDTVIFEVVHCTDNATGRLMLGSLGRPHISQRCSSSCQRHEIVSGDGFRCIEQVIRSVDYKGRYAFTTTRDLETTISEVTGSNISKVVGADAVEPLVGGRWSYSGLSQDSPAFAVSVEDDRDTGSESSLAIVDLSSTVPYITHLPSEVVTVREFWLLEDEVILWAVFKPGCLSSASAFLRYVASTDTMQVAQAPEGAFFPVLALHNSDSVYFGLVDRGLDILNLVPSHFQFYLGCRD